MADVVTRFKLETTQFDSKLRDASKSLSDISREASKAGKGFSDFTKDSVEAARALGNTESSASNTKDKLKELVAAFNDAAKAYNGLTAEQKNSDFGKAMSESLDQLKVRITDTKNELQNVGNTMKGTSTESSGLSGMLGGLADKFGLNITKLSGLGVALGATSAALKVSKDAFFASEANVDEWGRVMESGKSVYEGFLVALNTGDFSGFLSNINSIINAARAAYDALDRLGTMQRILAPSMSGQSKETQRLRTMLQTGTYIAPEDGRAPTPGMKNGQRLTPDQMKTVERQLGGSIQREVGYQRQLIGQTNTAIDRVYGQFASQLGMSVDEFRKGTSNMAEFERRVKGGENYTKWNLSHSPANSYYVSGASPTRRGNNPYAQYKGWDVFRVDGKAYGKLVELIQQRDNQVGAIYNLVGQGQRTINRVEGITPRGIMGGGGGGGGGSRGGHGGGGGTITPTYVPVEGSIDKQQALVAALQKQWRAAADDESRAQIKAQIEAANEELDRMQGKVAAPVGSLKYYNEELKKLQEEQQLVTNNNDWEYYQGQIDFVTKKMKELRGEMEQMATGHAGATANSIGEWISAQQNSLANMDMGSSEASQTYANIIDAKTLENVLNNALANGISISPDTVEDLWDQIIGGDNIPDSMWEDLQDTINNAISELGIAPIVIDVKTGNVTQGAKEVKEGWQDAAKAVQAVGGALQQLEDPGAKVAGIIGQAIANIALGFAQATAASAPGGPFAWIAAIAGGLGTMLSTIAAIKSATAGSYAEGGIVPGNNYNDGLIANVSSGELILNRAQQNSIAGLLTSNQGNSESRPYVDVETIWLGMGHYLKRKGMGEIVTTK